MARSAMVGSLRVGLGLDSAQFNAGLDRATTRLGRFGQLARTGLVALAAAGAAAAGALSLAVGQTVREADEIAKTADRVGLAVEELQRLRYAADLTGVAHSTLDMAMQRFSRRVGEAVAGTGELQAILEQYNIAVTDAEGRTRAQSDILKDLADVIANAGSRQEQLRIAFKAFDSEGAALVNTLRGGSAALQEMMDEADALGTVMSDKTARSAERFNDNMKRLSERADGVIERITAALLPTLETLSRFLIDASRDTGTLDSAIAVLVSTFKTLATSGVFVTSVFKGLGQAISAVSEGLMRVVQGDFEGAWAAVTTGFVDVAATAEDARNRILELWGVIETFSFQAFTDFFTQDPGQSPIVPRLGEIGDAAEKTIDLLEGLEMGVQRVGEGAKASFGQMAGDVSNLLGQIFQDSKAAGIAQAVLNTYRGISETLARYPWPAAGVMAGLHAAAGIAQVARIRSTSENSTSVSAAGLGGSTGAAAGQTSPGRSVTINLVGDMFSRAQMEELIGGMNTALGDGVRLNVARA